MSNLSQLKVMKAIDQLKSKETFAIGLKVNFT